MPETELLSQTGLPASPARIRRAERTAMKHLRAAVEDTYGPVYAAGDNEKRSPSEVIFARHVWMYLSRAAGWSLPEIARRVNQHHTTVLHGCRKVTEYCNSDPEFARDLAELAARAATGASEEREAAREYRRKPISVRMVRLYPDQVEEIAVLVAKKMMQSQGQLLERERGVA